jgi:hypothetical protein
VHFHALTSSDGAPPAACGRHQARGVVLLPGQARGGHGAGVRASEGEWEREAVLFGWDLNSPAVTLCRMQDNTHRYKNFLLTMLKVPVHRMLLNTAPGATLLQSHSQRVVLVGAGRPLLSL